MSASDRAIGLKDGRTMGYAEYGDPMGKPILLFHGTPGSRLSGALFDSVARAHQARILVADRPGYSTSSPVRHASFLDYVDDVVALMDAVRCDTFAVLGISGGAPFALACAAKIPERVTCCGLMSGVGLLYLPHGMDGMASVNRIVFTIARFMPAIPGAILPGQIKSSMPSMKKYIDAGTSPLPDVSPLVFAQLMADQLEAVRTGGKGIVFDMALQTHDWGFPLGEIQTKVFMWHGAEDNLAPVALARYVAEHIPGSVFKLVPGAGHAGTIACADEVMTTLVTC